MDIQPNIVVQPDHGLDLSKFQTICKISNGFFHEFRTQKARQLLDICTCEIIRHISIEGTQVPSYCIKIGTFVQTMDHCIFVKAKFENLVTFIFENSQNQNSIYLLSFQTSNPNLQGFSESLREAAQVVDYKTDSYNKTGLKQKMDLICEGELTQDMIESIEYIGNILKSVGSVFGSVAKNLVDPAEKMQNIMNNGIQIFSDKMVSEDNKHRWNTIKQTASNLNEKMTEMYKPIDNAFKLITSAIGQNFNNSQNKLIKNIKKFSIATAATLNHSYKKAEKAFMPNSEKENQSGLQQVHEVSTNNLNM